MAEKQEVILSERSNIGIGFAITIGFIVFGFGIAYANIEKLKTDVTTLQEIVPEIRERLSNIEGATGAKRYKPRKQAQDEEE